MLNDRVIRTAFIISFVGHSLFLGIPWFDLGLFQIKRPEELTVEIVIERPRLLPKIKNMGPEKKLKEPEPEVTEETVKMKEVEEEAMLRYQDMIKQKIEEARRYPSWAKKQGIEGTVNMTFAVLSNGSTRDIRVTYSSGFKILDIEAVNTVKRASPFPPIPAEFKLTESRMEITIIFSLQ